MMNSYHAALFRQESPTDTALAIHFDLLVLPAPAS
jgi:hypothetical protein